MRSLSRLSVVATLIGAAVVLPMTAASAADSVTRNARGVDVVHAVCLARARNLRTGEVCSARVVLPD